MAHTRQYILTEAKKAASNMAQFYNSDFIKNISGNGTTSDTHEYYTEVICEWLTDKSNLFDSIPTIRREAGYRTGTHDGVINNPNSKRDEEIMAKNMFKKNFKLLGEILDYQTPLKNIRDDKAGKIDLLAYNRDENVLRILELKRQDNHETMLRCVLEGYTYLKTVDTEKLLSSFDLPQNAAVKANPLVYYGGSQHKEITEGRPNLEKLIELLDCKPFYYTEENGEYIIREE